MQHLQHATVECHRALAQLRSGLLPCPLSCPSTTRLHNGFRWLHWRLRGFHHRHGDNNFCYGHLGDDRDHGHGHHHGQLSHTHNSNGDELDGHHRIETGKVFPVCGNTWRMLAETRFAPHFDFIGNFDTHYGIFDGCGKSLPFTTADKAPGACC